MNERNIGAKLDARLPKKSTYDDLIRVITVNDKINTLAAKFFPDQNLYYISPMKTNQDKGGKRLIIEGFGEVYISAEQYHDLKTNLKNLVGRELFIDEKNS